MLHNCSFHSNTILNNFYFSFCLYFWRYNVRTVNINLDSCIHGMEWNQVICWRFTLGQRKFAHRPSVGPKCWFYVGPTCWFYVGRTYSVLLAQRSHAVCNNHENKYFISNLPWQQNRADRFPLAGSRSICDAILKHWNTVPFCTLVIWGMQTICILIFF